MTNIKTIEPTINAANADHNIQLLLDFFFGAACVGFFSSIKVNSCLSLLLPMVGDACKGDGGQTRQRLMALVFVDSPPAQPTERRIISLRKANSREVKRYAET